MEEIIIGTTNPAKVAQIKDALQSFNLVVSSIDKDISLPEVIEDGLTAQENASKKATIYANFLNKDVLSMDNALYIDGLKALEQPGVSVRRVKGLNGRFTDEEMLAYYASLIERLGGQASGYWEFAICLVKVTGEKHETTITSPRSFTSKKSPFIVPGYPLESIQIDPKSGKYNSELTKEEKALFWQESIGSLLVPFIRSIYNDI